MVLSIAEPLRSSTYYKTYAKLRKVNGMKLKKNNDLSVLTHSRGEVRLYYPTLIETHFKIVEIAKKKWFKLLESAIVLNKYESGIHKSSILNLHRDIALVIVGSKK